MAAGLQQVDTCLCCNLQQLHNTTKSEDVAEAKRQGKREGSTSTGSIILFLS
jgi:hypothetical protein